MKQPPPLGSGRGCPACRGRQSTSWGTKMEMRLNKCAHCPMIYQAELPPEFQSGSFYQTTGTDFQLSPDKLKSDLSPVRYTREARLLRERVQRGRLLDVGCGTGGFLNRLQKSHPGDYQLEGTDIAGPSLQHAKSLGVVIHEGLFTDGGIEASAYDAVTFWAVLEHLPDPMQFLMEAFRVLKPSGYCIALVPNMNSLAVRFLGVKYRYIFPQHLNYFTAETLGSLFKQSGPWEHLEIRHTHFNPIVIWQDFRGDGGFVADQKRAGLLVKTNAMKANARMAPLRWLYRAAEATLAKGGLADNVVLIARKPSA